MEVANHVLRATIQAVVYSAKTRRSCIPGRNGWIQETWEAVNPWRCPASLGHPYLDVAAVSGSAPVFLQMLDSHGPAAACGSTVTALTHEAVASASGHSGSGAIVNVFVA